MVSVFALLMSVFLPLTKNAYPCQRRDKAAQHGECHHEIIEPCKTRALCQHTHANGDHKVSAVEEALAFRVLIERFGLTQDEVADKVGKSRPAVTNSLRLLELPDAVLEMISDGRLSMGHARAILGLNDKSDEARTALAEKVAAADLSVRETERLVKSLNAPKKEKKPQPERDEQTAAYYAELERKTMKILGRRVRISDGGEGKRRLELDYETSEDLEELLTKLCGSELFSE